MDYKAVEVVIERIVLLATCVVAATHGYKKTFNVQSMIHPTHEMSMLVLAVCSLQYQCRIPPIVPLTTLHAINAWLDRLRPVMQEGTRLSKHITSSSKEFVR